MAQARHSRGARATARSPMWSVLAAVTIALLVPLVHRRVLGTFFALDDLMLFQQVRGLLPWPVTPWRFLSGVTWFRAVTPGFGTQPMPYHAASLLLHASNAVLLLWLARRWGASAPAARLSAGLFAASRLHFTSLQAASSVGELLALSGTLGALLLVCPRPRPWLAAACFAAALLCKESVMLVPLAALTIPAMGEGVRQRTRELVPLLVVGGLLGVGLLAVGVFSGRLAGPAYAIRMGANVSDCTATLLGWSVDLVRAIPDQSLALGSFARHAYPAIALAVTLVAFRHRGTPLVRAGVSWWWLGVLPVLPLVGHTYLHYLYTPLAGFAPAAGGLLDLSFGSRRAETAHDAKPGPAP